MGRVVVLLVILWLGRDSNACPHSYRQVYLEPEGVGDPDFPWVPKLPSNPTLVLHERAELQIANVRVDGKLVPYELVPTQEPTIKLLRIRADAGDLSITVAGAYDGVLRYRILPELSISHVASKIETRVIERHPCHAFECDYDEVIGHALALTLPSDALLHRVEWSDGRTELVGPWPKLDRPEREGLSFRVVGVFSDGVEAVLMASDYAGPDRLPRAFQTDEKDWPSLVPGLLLVLGVLGFLVPERSVLS